MSIADLVLKPQQMTLEPGAHQLLEKHFEHEVSTREPDAKGQGLTLNSLQSSTRGPSGHIAHVRAQREHPRDTSTG